MTQQMISGKEWLTLKEASEASGRSLNSLRLLVHRKKIDRVKKVMDNGRSYWLIHRDTLDLPVRQPVQNYACDIEPYFVAGEIDEICPGEIAQEQREPEIDIYPEPCPDENISQDESMAQIGQISLHHYEEQRSLWMGERDSLLQGLMMYRFKFEELERQVKLLPAPPDVMSRELQWKDQTLMEAQKIIQEKDNSLAEARRILQDAHKNFDEERSLRDRIELKMKAELEREKNRGWWKKLLGIW